MHLIGIEYDPLYSILVVDHLRVPVEIMTSLPPGQHDVQITLDLGRPLLNYLTRDLPQGKDIPVAKLSDLPEQIS